MPRRRASRPARLVGLGVDSITRAVRWCSASPAVALSCAA